MGGAEEERHPLAIHLFGTVQVACNGQPLPPLRSKRGIWLLALLTLRHDREVAREWLAGTLWADSLEEQALANLRRTLTDLRDALGDEAKRLYAPTPQTLRLNLEGAWADAPRFDQAARRGDLDSLRHAVELYRGPLLEGCLEDWALEERLPRAESYLKALETLAQDALNRRAPAEALPYLRRVIAAEPLRETAHRALMQALFDSASYAAVTETYRNLRIQLRHELNAEPDPETAALYRRLRTETRARAANLAEAPAAPAPKPPVSAPTRGSLPRPLTPFLGREKDIQAVQNLLEQSRLVTLLGVGGVGKTRLSIQTAQEQSEEWAGGVWFIDLAPLTDPAHIAQTVAATLGLREEVGRTLLERLYDALAQTPTLLLLDNAEHLRDACAYLAADLLAHCPPLRLLTTSRQPLGIGGELLWRVEPLSLPDALPVAEEERAAALNRYEATRLFCERARALLPDFAPTAPEAEAIALICRRLDGLPLAIELAAARAGALSVERIAQRLDDRFRLLTGGSRTALPRQQTLRALFDWSHDLLDAPEQTLFRRLAVFRGGWALEAAEAICALPDSPDLAEYDILDTLASLVDKSLVQYVPHTARYRMLESIREYAAEKLRESEEAAACQARHAACYRTWAQEWSDALNGANAAEARAAFENDLDNARRSMDFAEEQGDQETAVAFGKALFGFLRMRGLYTECDARLARAEEAARSLGDTPSLARLLNQRGLVAWERFRLEEARARFAESLTLSRTLEDRPRILSALVNLGNVAWGHSDYAEAQRLYSEALTLAVETQQTRHEATLRLNLGILSIERGDYAEAEAYLAASLEMHQQMDSEEYVAHTCYNLAELYRCQERHAVALDYTERSAKIYAELGNLRGLALAKVRLGAYLLESGRPEEAEPPIEEGLRIARELGDRAGEMYALEAQAQTYARAGRHAEALALLNRSSEMALKAGDRKHAIQALTTSGMALRALGEASAGDALLHAARTACEAIGLQAPQLVAHWRLANPLDSATAPLSLEDARALLQKFTLKMA